MGISSTHTIRRTITNTNKINANKHINTDTNSTHVPNSCHCIPHHLPLPSIHIKNEFPGWYLPISNPNTIQKTLIFEYNPSKPTIPNNLLPQPSHTQHCTHNTWTPIWLIWMNLNELTITHTLIHTKSTHKITHKHIHTLHTNTKHNWKQSPTKWTKNFPVK